MTPQLSPESLEQIRAIVQEAIAAAFRGQEPRFEGIERRFRLIDERFDSVDQQFVQVRQEIQDSAAENRRHFGVLNENLTGKLELVIEGFTGQNQRMDRLESEVHEGLAQVDRQMVVIWSRLPRRRKKR
jgi:uncharacterized protein YPO0396